MVFERDVASRLTSMLRDEKPKKAMDIEVTEREREVLDLVSQGLSNKEIAKELYLSEGTVRNYVTGLLEKFSLRDRTQLAIYYIKNFND
jgi:DNA-binding NarL/FixJ family response regulator